MSIALVTPPDEDVVSLEEMKAHLLYEGDDQDDYITSLIVAVVSTLDPASGGSLGRALRLQTWELWPRSFPASKIELPYPPLSAILSVAYVDGAGNAQTLTPNVHYTRRGDGEAGRQYIEPIGSWPSSVTKDTVRIRFTCGYSTDEDRLPGGIKAYIKLVVNDLFHNRGATTSDAVNSNPNLSRLLDPHRIF